MSQEVIPECINKAELCRRMGISPRGLENLVNRGQFPPPVRIGKYVYWSDKAYQKWRKKQFADQEAWEP